MSVNQVPTLPKGPIVDDSGQPTLEFQRWLVRLFQKANSSVLVCTQATFPALTAQNAGVIYISDYLHESYWNGISANFTGGDNPGRIEGFLVNPGLGWHVCDGSVVNYLNPDGTLTAITLPDLTGQASYLKFGAVASAEIQTPIAPTLTMDPYTPAGTNSVPILTMNPYTPAGTNSAPGLTMNSYTPAGTISAPAFTGTPTTVTNTNFSTTGGATAGLTSIGGSTTTYTPAGTVAAPVFTGTPATLTGTVAAPVFTGTVATLTGSVSAPIFTGTQATLTGTISATAEPQHIVLRPYFRL